MCLTAQEQPRTLTQMIVGASAGPGRGKPSALVGFELKPSSSKVTWRLTAEYSENSKLSCIQICEAFQARPGDSWVHSSTFGLQALGLRRFRSGRLQPYLFGGVGLYSSHYREDRFFLTPDPVNSLTTVTFEHSDVSPRVLWGMGLSFRIRGLNLFGEAALPTWASPYRSGPQSTITL